MPEIGDIEIGRTIGNTQSCKFMWSACVDCGKERWVKLIAGKPQSPRCNQCASKRAAGTYPRKPLTERFWAKVLKTETCWIWQGFQNPVTGYGQANKNQYPILTHRLAYELTHGPLPSGHDLEIDHLCRNRLCVNPAHLELVSHQVNNNRGIGITAKNVRKTHCPYGHPYDLFNTYHRPDGGRDCKACMKNRENIYKARQGVSLSRV